jgi:hypothetical protein
MFAHEKLHLRALPADPYSVAIHRKANLSRDCHIIFEKNYYSAPHLHRGKELDVWATATQVEIYSAGERLAVHARRQGSGQFATDTSHYPPAQQAFAEEDLQKVLGRSERVGVECEKLIKDLLKAPHPLRNFRRAQGILALSIAHGSNALERACRMANLFDIRSLRYIERVIKTRRGEDLAVESKVAERATNPFLRGTDNVH